MRLPPVTSVWPIESVSATIGRTSSTVKPEHLGRDHRHRGARAADIDRAGDDAGVPSLWMLTVAEDCMPPLNQKPEATPRPRLLPVKLATCSAGCS